MVVVEDEVEDGERLCERRREGEVVDGFGIK